MAGGARALPRSWSARGLVAGVLAASWLWWGWRLVEAGFVALNRPVSAASSAPHAAPRVFCARSARAPHEVGECHRLCPVSFSDFVCLLAGGRDEGFDNVYLFLTSCVFWGRRRRKARMSCAIPRLRVSIRCEDVREGARAGAHTRARGSVHFRVRGVASSAQLR